jgi:hypothetical protein
MRLFRSAKRVVFHEHERLSANSIRCKTFPGLRKSNCGGGLKLGVGSMPTSSKEFVTIDRPYPGVTNIPYYLDYGPAVF